jgi:hypothetical protein
MGKNIEVELKFKLLNIEDVEQIRDYLQNLVSEIGAQTNGLDLEGYPFGLLKKKGLLDKARGK